MLALCVALCAETRGHASESGPIDFNRDIRPILSEHCYACHGPDQNKRKAELRLDVKEGLFRKRDGVTIVDPKNVEGSELWRRITTDDAEERMPPRKTGKALTEAQTRTIKNWISEGALWKGHWAYLKPAAASPAKIEEPGFTRSAIDRFILEKLQAQGLKHAPEAGKRTLARRLSLDLTGLPPSPEDVAAFLSDDSPNAYEKRVDRLLASPHFGERMAVFWLDLVRYGDSIGYHSDNPMNVSPYRDYVIAAFNTNKPFDRFTIEQIAGDLLPDATLQTRVASAYNRLLMTTEEGGAQAKEYEAKYAADRVRDLSVAWLGATIGCAQCHDHKYDPYKTRDFYRLAAFFADLQEASVGKREPGIPVPNADEQKRLDEFDARIQTLTAKLAASTPELIRAQDDWEQATLAMIANRKPLNPTGLSASGGIALESNADGTIRARGPAPAKSTYSLTFRLPRGRTAAILLEALVDAQKPPANPGLAGNGNFVLSEIRAMRQGAGLVSQPVVFSGAFSDHSQENYPVAAAIDGKLDTGWAILPQTGKSHLAILVLEKPITAEDDGSTLVLELVHASIFPGHEIGAFRVTATASDDARSETYPPPGIVELLKKPAGARTDAERAELASYYRGIAPSLTPIRSALEQAKRERKELEDRIPKAIVSVSGAPRVTRVLARGNWQDETGEIVAPGVPEFLPESPQINAPAKPTRLDLARWLVSAENPLTARVFVNRVWKLFFGRGLARRVDDLGSQGDWPDHAELLDWLAVDFRDHGWDVKRLVKTIVLSGAYRMSSVPSRESLAIDPENRLLARQGRFRLDAEFVRDGALAVSGLLSPKIGGPSVKPYQPEGYWDALNFPTRKWEKDSGEALYRRGLYTHLQRTFPHPSLIAFDAPSREECTAERARSNIPQQALVLLNDPEYVEAARVFAERIVRDTETKPGSEVNDRIRAAFVRATSREPLDREISVLSGLYRDMLAQYAQDPASAARAIAVGDRPPDPKLNPVELAAWTAVTRTILNLQEVITRN